MVYATEDSLSAHHTSPALLFTAVTFNLWRFCDAGRLPLVLDALSHLGADLAGADSPHLPDLLLFQEIECPAVTEDLAAALRPTHELHTLICADQASGAPRSGVAVAVRRASFQVAARTDVVLGQLWGDHARCGLQLRLRAVDQATVDQATELDLLNVHHSPHPLWKLRQTRRLTAHLAAREPVPLLLGGDFNFNPAAASYRLLTQQVTDPYPAGRGKTHWLAGRVDFFFTGGGLALDRPMDQAHARTLIRPTRIIRPLYRCPDDEWTQCALSDHLPEGGRFVLADAGRG